MALTPPSRSNLSTPQTKTNAAHQSRTPQSKHHHLNFPKEIEHPVEVIGRIRDHPEQKIKRLSDPTTLQIENDGKSLRMRTEIGYRDFSLDGISVSEEDDLDGFYGKFVEFRVNGDKMGQKCTIIMYGVRKVWANPPLQWANVQAAGIVKLLRTSPC